MKKVLEYRTPEGFFDADIDITKDEWLGILDDPSIKDYTYLDVLTKFLRQPDHQATCKALGKQYDCSFNYFNTGVTNFGKYVKAKLNRFYVENTKGEESFWNIAMTGRNTKGGFEWTLRKELVDALQEYLIHDLIARYKKYVMSSASVLAKEKYKWELLTETKGKSISEIFETLVQPGMNLLDMPRAGFAIKHMLTENPIELESSFRELLNTDRSFSENYSAFMAIIKPVAESKYQFVFPDERTAAAFLTCAKPDTYTFYMDKIYQEYCLYLGEETKHAGSKYIHYLKLVSRLSQLANNDKELRYFLMEETKGLLWSDLLVGQDILWEMQQSMIVEQHSLGFAWTAFYEEFADKIAPYADNQSALFEKIRNAFAGAEQTMAKLAYNGDAIRIDPFTIYGLFNKRESHDKRTELAEQLKLQLDMTSDVPLRFDGIPVLNPLSAAFYSFESEQKGEHIDNIWKLFLAAIAYSAEINTATREAFIQAYDVVRGQPRIKWNLTMALFWMRPETFISLDSNNRAFILGATALSEKATAEIASILGKMNQIPTGENYLHICDIVREEINTGACPYSDFLEFSRNAWESGKAPDEDDDDTPEEHKDGMNHWLIVANPEIWSVSSKPVGAEEFYTFYNEKGNPRKIFKNFKDSAPGDLVIFYEATPKKQAVCLGEITIQDGKELHFRKTADLDKPVDYAVMSNTPELSGMEFLANRNGSVFRLTESEYNKIIELSKVEDEPEDEYEPYTKEDFLKEVFIDEKVYEKLVSILQIKKNLILKGAPGVGKTFAAKRLAFSIMGEKNTDRVQFVQFHQSYSYEDFVMGYRPNDSGGFVLRPGVFYKFCKKAEMDPGHDYYFIIDEINRGNLSKIFGELFMLIEADKREEELHLAYREELFSVPKNIYIIGMLNTADRSLAMIDYALRRRFSFVEMEPAIDTLIKVRDIAPDSKLGKLLAEVKNLNDDIKGDPSLGSGFRIGHSYFCNSDAVSEVHFSNIVEYEIIPMLEEYWFDNPAKAEDWSNRLREAIK